MHETEYLSAETQMVWWLNSPDGIRNEYKKIYLK